MKVVHSSGSDETAAYVVLRTQDALRKWFMSERPEEVYCSDCSPEGVPDGALVMVLTGKKLDRLREGWDQSLRCSSCGTYL